MGGKGQVGRIAVTGGMLAATVMASGCGSSDTPLSSNTSHSKPTSTATHETSSPSSSTTPGEVLTQHDLDQAALIPTDLTQYKIQTIGGRGKPVGLLDTSQRIPIAPAACQPVYDAIRYRTAYPATARVVQAAEDISQEDGQQTLITLASYATTTAARAVSDLHRSLGTCTAFQGIPGADEYTYKNVKALPDPHLGDEAVSYRMTKSVRGEAASMVPSTQEIYVVVRIGATLVTFSSFSIPEQDGEPAQIPQQVLTAQLKKLS